MQDEQTAIAEIRATQPRRLFAYGALFALGAMVIFVAFMQPPAFGFQVFLILFGAGSLFMAERLRRSTLSAVRLYDDHLRDSSGEVLAWLKDIERVERGPFAAKPSNGFVLIMKEKTERHWAPGLWWRIGRRVGVGGVTAPNAAKFMAEQIALRLNGVH